MNNLGKRSRAASAQRSGAAGRNGESVRSDCRIEVTMRDRGGIDIILRSRVEALYGRSIRSQCVRMLGEFGIAHAVVTIDDSGALPFVIAARMEAAVKRADPLITTRHMPEGTVPRSGSARDRLRRTRLYLPGNSPHLFLNAGLHKPDCIILDLEDSVAPGEKDAARILVRNALLSVNFGAAERMVRINPLPAGLEDLREIARSPVQTILVPKCETAAQLCDVDRELDALSAELGIERKIFLLPIIESALGVIRAFEIASASAWNCALAIGLEDYTADIGVERTRLGAESLYARSAVITAAKAAGIQALDSVFSDVDDEEGLRMSASEAKAIGFDGKGCIHPRQIRIIHDAMAPTDAETAYAQRVVEAYEEAQKTGSGVVALGSKMIDAPVVKRAQRTLALAKAVVPR